MILRDSNITSPSAQGRINLCFAGLGNLGSKVVYLAARPHNRVPVAKRNVFFKHGIVKPNEIAKENLKYLSEREFFEHETSFFVVGDNEDEQAVRNITGGHFNVFNERDFQAKTALHEVDMCIDFTYDAKLFVAQVAGAKPIIVQSNNYGYGTLYVPPLMEEKQAVDRIYRTADCSLGGTIPVLAKIRNFFQELFIQFITDRNVGKGPESEFDNAFYFSDSFGRRKSNEFTSLSGVHTVTNIMSSAIVNPFYLATISGRLKREKIEEQFGSWTKFERGGFFSPLFENDPLVHVSMQDNNRCHRLPREPPTIEEFAEQYPNFPEKPFIVLFRRTFLRQNGCMISFTIGFDVNLAAAISNIRLMEALGIKEKMQ